MGEAGSLDIAARFSWPVAAANTARVYRTLASGDPIGGYWGTPR